MIVKRTKHFDKDFVKLPLHIQNKTINKVIPTFVKNIKHPSLRTKKIKGHLNLWEASIDIFYRFTFEIHNGYYILRRIGPHDKVLRNP